jgi:NAD(P)-dependent dehydrogenase (short-subunit alcohol dehydrogenase family)
MSLEGRSVLILGGTSGMGLATAQAARRAGATVAIVGRDAAKAETARQSVGGGTVCGVLDARDTGALATFAEGLDAIDHVVSFTGNQPAAPVAEADHEMFASAFEARVWAARNACAIAAPRMPPDGSFVFCSGLSALRPRRGRSAGAVATAALESFCRAMAVELAPLRVNAICPGAFGTDVLRRALGDEAAVERLAAAIPLGRIGDPAEIAHAVMFLLTNTYTTGTTLRVDGGFALT